MAWYRSILHTSFSITSLAVRQWNHMSVSYHRQSDCWTACWSLCLTSSWCNYPGSKLRGANMGPIWGRQNPGGPHVGPMNLAIWLKMHQGTQQPYHFLTWRILTSCVTLRFNLLKSGTVNPQSALMNSLIKQCHWNLMGIFLVTSCGGVELFHHHSM